MGYWGDRAKDGDSPLDLMGNFQDKGGDCNTFLRKSLATNAKSPHRDEIRDAFAHFGCATIMIEKGLKVDTKLFTKLFNKAKAIDDGICHEDINFYQAYIGGVVLKKKPMKVMVEIDVVAFDEKDAKLVAAKRIGIGFGDPIRENDDVRVSVKAS